MLFKCDLFAVLTLSLTLLAGCSSEKVVPVVPADGTVTLNGVGLNNVLIRFVPEGKEINGNIESSGVTDEQGNFRLTASDGRDGAVPGPGHVLLVDMAEERPVQGEEAVATPRFSSDYSVLNGRSLTATVTDGVAMKVEVPAQ